MRCGRSGERSAWGGPIGSRLARMSILFFSGVGTDYLALLRWAVTAAEGPYSRLTKALASP
jgi:hypothetical protein